MYLIKKHHLILLSGILMIFINASLYGQIENNNPTDIGIDFQVYPTGIIPGLRLELTSGNKNAYLIRAGYNLVRHRDLGKHEDERGGGFGFTLGYKRYFKDGFSKFFLALKSDLWFNSVDWKDNIGMPNELSGNTKVTVLQPTLEGGYAFELANGNIVFTPTIALGAEINIKTDGEEVGEGTILLLGLNLMKRF